MERSIRKNTSWLRRFAWQRRDRADSNTLDRGLYSEACFRDKLLQERMRAERSKKAMVLMMVDAESICTADRDDEIADLLGEEVNRCVRDTDICCRLKEGGVIGVILTEIEPEKQEAAQKKVVGKTRERLAALWGPELADRIAITFHVLNPAADGNGIFDMTFTPEILRRPAAVGGDRLTMSKLAEDAGGFSGTYQDGARSG